ncbi:MAG TPA: serine/threonine-protein kinase [Pseudomonadota bacterium]|nr:serine/threonine-protein kinase [Pseudomonadota bacterium]
MEPSYSSPAGVPVLDPEDWHRTRTLWVGAISSVDEVILRATGQTAVLKHMHAEHRQDPGIAARCVNEGLILRHLHAGRRTPGIPKLLGMGMLPSRCPALLLERLGESLAESLGPTNAPSRTRGRGLGFLLHVGHHVATALAQVHSLGIVHRDLRPDNVLFAAVEPSAPDDGFPDAYLIDFGLAKHHRSDGFLPVSTGDEDILGTDLYMAPEQWECAKRVTGSADIYALGVILYQLACGHPPFADERRQVLMYQHLVAIPAALPAQLPKSVSQLIMAMLAKRALDRPSAQECSQVLAAQR